VEVLDKTAARVDSLLSKEQSIAQLPAPKGPIVQQRGLLWQESSEGTLSPVFLGGFVGTDQVFSDLPFFTKIGASLIQRGRGPRVMARDGSLGAEATTFIEGVKRCGEHGIGVDFIIEPHRLPSWAWDEAEDMGVEGQGFIGYKIDHPAARQALRQWLETIVPILREEAALRSICISNEPTWHYSGRDKYSRPAWRAWLLRTHGYIGALNDLYGTDHLSFDEVEPPAYDSKIPEDLNGKRRYYDWVIFNQEHFADWHRWVHDLVKRVAPEIPTHAKPMARIYTRRFIWDGLDPERICRITDLAGCDSWAGYRPNWKLYAYEWHTTEWWYDLLHSFRGQPVIDSEKHWIEDGAPPEHWPARHTYSAIWQGMLHHLSAWAHWVWAEPNWRGYEGSIYIRPAALHAAGQAMLDARRLANELAAVNLDPAKVAILYSMNSIFWQPDHPETVMHVYKDLQFLGQPVTFISESQLANDQRSPANAHIKWIILPRTTHVNEDAVSGLVKFVRSGGHVLTIGSDALGWDEYHRPRKLSGVLQQCPNIARPAAAGLEFERKHRVREPIASSGSDKDLLIELARVLKSSGLDLVRLTDVSTKQPARDIEFRVVPYRGDLLVPMIDFTHSPRTVELDLPGQAKDLISGKSVDLSRLVLESMAPVLLRIAEAE